MGCWHIQRKSSMIPFTSLNTKLFQGADGSRMPSALELELATIQGESFGNAINKVTFA